MDGLTISQFYAKVAVPMIGKAFWISFLLQFVLAMGNFDLPYVLTQGGPGYSSTTLPLLVFDEIFLTGNFSGGEVVASILGLMATLPPGPDFPLQIQEEEVPSILESKNT